MTRLSTHRGQRWPLRALVATSAALALTLTGCSGQAGGNDAPADDTALTGDCGTYPDIAPSDPEGIVAALPEKSQAAYNGYPDDVITSAWAQVPKKEGPWKVGLLFGALLNDFAESALAQIQADFADAKAKGLVEGELLTSWAADSASQSPTTQIAGFQDLVRAGADVIITVPLSGEALAPVVDEAGEQGVVTVAFSGRIPSKYAINLFANSYLNVADTVSQIASDISGKGNVLIVRGLSLLPADPQMFDATTTILGECPDIKVVGELEGGYTQAGAKTVVMQWLTANPGAVDAVIQFNTMGPGVISAFQQAGRPVPPVSLTVAQVADVAYLHDHLAEGYKSYGTLGGGANSIDAAFRIAMRTLSGQGPKTTEFAFAPPQVTPENVDDYYTPGTDINSAGEINGEGQAIMPDEMLDPLFNNPTAPIGG